MFIKSNLKFSLSALLLAASVSVYAADNEVTLKGATTPITWAKFVENLNNGIKGEVPTDIATAWTNAQRDLEKAQEEADAAPDSLSYARSAAKLAQTQYDVASDTLTARNNRYNRMDPKSEQVVAPWLEDAYKAAVAFNNAYNADEVGDGSASTCTMWYKFGTGKTATVMTLSFLQPDDLTGWTPITEGKYYTDIVNASSVSVTGLQIYLGRKKDAEGNVVDGYNYGTNGNYVASWLSSYTKTDALTIAVSELRTLTQDKAYITTQPTAAATALLALIKTAETAEAAAKVALTAANDTVAFAQDYVSLTTANLTKAQNAYNTAQANYEKAEANADVLAKAAYDEITLEGDINANVAITVDYAGTIYGNNNIINVTVPNGAPLFAGKFSGHMTEAAVNGPFARTLSNAGFDKVASWADGTGRFYNASGTLTDDIASIGALGFAARAYYGVDFATKKIVALTDASKVYNITVNKLSGALSNQYVQLSGETFTGEDGTVIDWNPNQNVFVKSETNDAAIVNIANVYYGTTCNNVNITDKTAFYCPVDLTAKTVTYNRPAFKAGYNVVCLPFELTYDMFSVGADDLALCTYDQETASKFWFVKNAESIAANTPVLIDAKVACSFNDLTNITIKQTPESQRVELASQFDQSASYGVFKATTSGQIAGAVNMVYGLAGNEFKYASSTDQTINPFRMVIRSAMAPSRSEDLMTRGIGIRDENGADITDRFTAIEDVKEAASSFSVAGGQGEIIITSEADYGKVVVYSLDGRVAGVANVVAGTTSVNVQDGIYIVMGKKVLVK